MSGNRWLANARAVHTRALGSAQAFPLFGDGEHVAGYLLAPERDPELSGAELAEARYRDWDHARRQGAVESRAEVASAYEAPPLALTAEELPAVQTRLTLPRRAIPRDDTQTRLAEATALLAALVEEFGALFPDELAEAAKFIARHAPR